MNSSVRPAFTAEELTRLVDQVPAVVWACDKDLRFTFSAGSALAKLGLRTHQVVGMRLEEYFSRSPRRERLLEHIRRVFNGETVIYELEFEGTIFESHVAPLRDERGDITGVIGMALDITDRRAVEEELLINRHRVEHATALFPVIHYELNAHGGAPVTSDLRNLFGLAENITAYAYDDILSHVHPDDRTQVFEARRLGLENRRPYSAQFRLIRPDGKMLHLRVHATPVFGEQGELVRTIGTLTDLTEEFERQREVTKLLEHDGITGLPNRTFFTEHLRHDLPFASGTNELMALVLFDLDRFSRINDSLGNLAGDEYLRAIASRLRTFSEGTQDLAARIGGDEFAVLLRGAQRRGDLVRRIESLRALVEEPVTIDDKPLHVSVSAGVAFFPFDAADQTLIQKADLALSRARSTSNGRTEYYDLMIAEHVASSVRLEHSLHAAIRDSQLVPYYQAIVDVEGRLTALEALARWNHPEFGLLAPATFLDVAEESGLVVNLGERILGQACAEVARLRGQRPGLRLNFNLSSRHLLSRGIAEVLERALAASGLPADALQIEVTEQSLIADVSAGRRAIDAFRVMGCTVVIDDFGTGYNTLGYVKSYHVDGIKLDRSFIRDLTTDRYSRAICEGVMALARSLQLPVIAEGIETLQQRDACIAMGAAELQGFLYGRPVSAAEIGAQLPL